MTVESMQEGIGHAQVALRVQNERIEASADALGIFGPIPFICECPSQNCSEIVRLTFDEYEAIREHPRRFFNVPGHERASVDAGAERVILGTDTYTVVEKCGVAGQVADDSHAYAT